MALNDLIGNKFFRVAGALAALAAPYVVGCEGDSTTNKNYYGEGNGGGEINSCEEFVESFQIQKKCCTGNCSDQVKGFVKECNEEAYTYNSADCFSCISAGDSYTNTADICTAIHDCMEEKCGDFT